jgi:hypothetical protein
MPQVAVLLYVYHVYEWDEFRDLLLKCNNIKLFIALCIHNDNSHIINDCHKHFNNFELIYTKNKGLDLGPFLQQLKKLNSHKFPFFIKLHTRPLVQDNAYNWNLNLLNSTIGSNVIFQKNLNKIQNTKNINVLCDRDFILEKSEGSCLFQIQEFCNIVNMPFKQVCLGKFMSGGIFIGRTKSFKRILTTRVISKIYTKLEDCDPSSEEVGQYTQALECFLGYIASYNNSNIAHTIQPLIKIQQEAETLNVVLTYKNTCYLQDNPHIRGTVTDRDQVSLNILWNTDIYQTTQDYDIKEYKFLYDDLKVLTDEEARNHFVNHGQREGRVKYIKTIREVFDAQFYSKRYGIPYSEAFMDYLLKGRFESRVYSKQIITDCFDYGFYISYYNHFKKHYYNQFSSYQDYLHTNKKCNNILKLKYNSTKIQSTLCVYVASAHDVRDEYIIANNLNMLSSVCDFIILVTNRKYNTKHKNIHNVITTHDDSNYNTWLTQSIISGLEYKTDLHNNIILLTDKSFILKDLKPTILKLQSNDIDFLSMTDSFTKKSSVQNLYHLHLESLMFKVKDKKMLQTYLKKYIKNFKSSSEDLEIALSSFLLKQKKKIGALLTPTKEAELLWADLLNVEINLLPNLLYKYEIPVVNKHTLGYFYQLIDKTFKKQQGSFLLPEWLSTGSTPPEVIQDKAVCLIVHTHSDLNTKEYIRVIDKLSKKIKNLTVYFTGNKDVYNKVLMKHCNILFFETLNKGMDIGPFIKLMDFFHKENIQYDYIVKIQDKKTKAWRTHCIDNIINNATSYINMLEQDQNTSVCGPYAYLTPLDYLNFETLDSFIKRYKLPFNYFRESKENSFIAGTMFILKHCTFNKFVENFKIDLDYEYNMCETGRVVNDTATQTHAWERILTCLLPTVMNTKIKCI